MSFTQTQFAQAGQTLESTGTAEASQPVAGGPVQFKFSIYGHNQSAKRKQELYELSRVIHPITMENINSTSNLDNYYRKQKQKLYQNMINNRNQFDRNIKTTRDRAMDRQLFEIDSMQRLGSMRNVSQL